MQYVLTLTGAPRAGAVSQTVLTSARGALVEAGAAVGEPDMLCAGDAVDLPFEAPDPETDPDRVLARVRDRLSAVALDCNVSAAAGRRKRLLIADMDSTIIIGESLDELAAHAGIRDRVATITARAMRGELAFEDALRARVALLKGLPADTVDTVVAALRPTPGAAELVATMKAAGAYCALVSGGFKAMTRAIGTRLGFDEDRANTLLVENGVLTGTLSHPILGRDAKRHALSELAGRRGLSQAAVLAVGDGANDLAMIAAAGMGVAFRAKPAVRAAARYRIEHGDLRALLYLQGYRAREIVAG